MLFLDPLNWMLKLAITGHGSVPAGHGGFILPLKGACNRDDHVWLYNRYTWCMNIIVLAIYIYYKYHIDNMYIYIWLGIEFWPTAPTQTVSDKRAMCFFARDVCDKLVWTILRANHNDSLWNLFWRWLALLTISYHTIIYLGAPHNPKLMAIKQ